MDVLSRFDGRLLAADESPEVVDGDWPHEKVVLIEFKDREEAVVPQFEKFVIPAHAGIAVHQRVQIPAFAGMT